MTEPRTMSRRPRPKASEEAEEYTEEAALESPGDALQGGWTAAQKEQDASSPYAQALKPDGNLQIIKILEDRPYANFRRHWIKRTGENGQTFNRPYTCLDSVNKPCPLCGIGDSPQAVSSFNVALIGDDGQALLRSWDVSQRVFNTLKGFNSDPRIGPLTKGFYGVNKTGGKNGTSNINVIPIGLAAAREDYNIDPEDAAEKAAALKPYDAMIVQIPTTAELKELAAELDDYS